MLKRSFNVGIWAWLALSIASCSSQSPSGDTVEHADGSLSGELSVYVATLDDGLARFDCSIYREVEAGDHTVVLLRLHAVEHVDTSLPLVFHRSSFGRLEASA